ncbi:hypothetical protein KAB87_004103 [Salmonella enterica]|nr:hypothetical protein [Salmonella enterica]
MRYILLIIAIMGGLLSFNSYSAVVNQCSATAPSETGSFTIYVSEGRVHTNINGCDYALPPSSPVPKFIPLPDGSSSSSFELTFYPTGHTENINVKAGPSSFSESDYDKKHKPDFDKINDQTQRYCSQPGKCEPDEDGQGMYPKDDNDYVDFVKKDDASHDKPGSGLPDGTDSGTGMTGGSTDSSSDSTSSDNSTPSPSEPEIPYPVNAGVSQLNELFISCKQQAYSIPDGASFDALYNSVAHNCNAILDRLSSLLVPNEMTSISYDGQKFLTKSESGYVLSCHITTTTERKRFISTGYYPSMVPDAIGSYVDSLKYQDGHLNLNYTTNDGANAYCDSVYQNHIASQNNPSENSDNSSSSHDSSNNIGSASGSGSAFCPVGYYLSDFDNDTCFSVDSDGNIASVILPDDCPLNSDCRKSIMEAAMVGAEHLRASGSFPGVGHSDMGDGDNGDVVAAINAFHADANKNHQEVMKELDVSGASLDGVKGSLFSDINKLIGDTKNELNGSYDEALAELKGIFGDIDSYVPDIKLSFDLPTQFTAGIMGRCVPLVFDFNISLVGFQPYHFHAEGIQACQLYDAYIRSIVEYMLYFMTALACRRVFTRAAEFITSQS